MKRSTVILALLVLAALAPAQWLDRTFWLTDSFPGLTGAGAILINPVTGRLYIPPGYESSTGLHIYDPATRQKRLLDVMESGVIQGMVVSRELGRLYLMDARDDEVLSFDLDTDSLLATRFRPETPLLITINSARRKLYVANDDAFLEVFDALTGGRIRYSQLSPTPTALVLDSLRDRLYSSSSVYDIRVIDCGSDTTVARVPGTGSTYAMVRHPSREQLVCWTYQFIKFVDINSLAVVESVACAFLPADDRRLALLSPGTNRLYLTGAHDPSCAGPRLWSNEVAIVDLSFDSTPPVCIVSLGDSFIVRDAAVDETDGKLYVRDYMSNDLVVIGAGDSVSGRIALDPPDWETYGMAWDSSSNRLYVAERDGLVVVDCATDSVVDRVSYFKYGYVNNWLAPQPSTSRLYFGSGRGVGWVGRSDTVEHWLPGEYLELLGADNDAGRLYLHNSDRLLVYDCAADTFTVTRSSPGKPASSLLLPELHRLYLLERDSMLWTYDTRGDSFLASTRVEPGALRYSPRTGRLYAGLNVIHEVDPLTGMALRSSDWSPATDFVVNSAGTEIWKFANRSLTLVDCDSLRNRQAVDLPAYHTAAVQDIRNDKLYCPRGGSKVTVFDCAERRIIDTIVFPHGWSEALVDTAHEKLYIASSQSVNVIDCRADSIVSTIRVPGTVLAADASDNIVYAFYPRKDQLSVIRDNPPGVAEGRNMLDASRITPEATVVRGVLNLTPDIRSLTSDIVLLDASGRRVLSLKPGRNDVSTLAPGVYFIHSTIDIRHSSFAKVVLTR